jgi:hypothetical protein
MDYVEDRVHVPLKLSHDRFLPFISNSSSYQSTLFWYSDHGGETVVSLDRGRFYGLFVRPRMRMSERVNE